jgi:nitrate reductase molybdenum cofactor assembly chaperone NarJ/NarW
MRFRRTLRPGERAQLYKLCSLALQYPDAELIAARDELAATVATLPHTPAANELEQFCPWWAQTPPLQIAQHYVETFDLHKRSSLYLTFYALGDRRERGLALLRLKKLYRAAGLPLEGRELPDYLPIMLEFAAAAPPGYGETVLREHRAALELVRLGVQKETSPYAHVLDAVCLALGELSPIERAGVGRLAASGPPEELVGLEPFAPPQVMPNAGAGE